MLLGKRKFKIIDLKFEIKERKMNYGHDAL